MSEDLLYTNTFVDTDVNDRHHSKGVKNEFYKYIKQKRTPKYSYDIKRSYK